LLYRHLPPISNVDRLMEIAHRELENSVDQIRHITKRSRLRAVAENRKRFAGERLADKRRHNPPVPQSHPRTVSVEDAHDLGVDLLIPVIGHRHRLGEWLPLMVNTAG